MIIRILFVAGIVSIILTVVFSIKAAEENVTAKKKAAVTAGIVSLVSLSLAISGLINTNYPPEPSTTTTAPINDQSIDDIIANEDDKTSTLTNEETGKITTNSPSLSYEDINHDSPPDDWDGYELNVVHEEALICTYDGDLSEEDEEKSYSYVPPRKGTYRFEISGLYKEREVSIYIYDAGNGLVEKREWIGNNDGITTRDLISGQDYSILVKQEKGFSPFTLSICSQAETVKVNGAERIIDSIVFSDQENKYEFMPELEGTYRFEINELYAEKQISMYIFDEGDGLVSRKEWIENGNGITIDSLQPEKPYTIIIKQAGGYSSYVLDIGYPNETRPLLDNGSINGDLTFTDQIDIYSFIPAKEGSYFFKISKMQTGKVISMFIIDEGGGTVDRHEWIGNDSGIDTSQLQIDKQYYVKIVQKDGFTPYTLSVERRYLSDE